MNLLEIIPSIAKYLGRLREEVKILNSVGHFTINKEAEDIVVELLNQTLDLKLKNLNSTERNNYPAIDLLDAKKRIAVQVTATGTPEKIKKTLDKFFSNNINDKADILYLYILTEKANKYSSPSLTTLLKALQKKYKVKKLLSFDISQILDRRDILKILLNKNKIDQLKGLESFLTKHFAEITVAESLNPYLEELKSFYYQVVFADESGMTLEDIYIDPHYSIYEEKIKSKENFTETPFKSFRQPKKNKSLYALMESFIDKTITQDLESSNMLLILGYPGQGKTSCLKKFLNHYIIKNKGNRDIFYYKLKDVRNGRVLIDSPFALLKEEAQDLTSINLTNSRFYKSILLLDGLDELFMKDNMTLDDIEKICKEISRELSKHQEMQVIITSRHGYVTLDRIKKERFLAIQITPFNLQQQIEWITNFQKFHPVTSLTIEQLKEINNSNNYRYRDIKDFVGQPILLQIIASLTGKLTFDNVTKSEIYDQLFTQLIERSYSSDGRLENFIAIEKEDLRSLIQNIAFFTYRKGTGYITKKELLEEKEIRRYLEKFPNKDFQNNIKGILISFYFKESRKENEEDDNVAIEFLHRSLLEYMTAEKIIDRVFDKYLDRNSKMNYIIDTADDIWKEWEFLFSHNTLSTEVSEYMVDMLSKMPHHQKRDLAQRLSTFLSELIEKDFLFKYDKNEVAPILIATRCFNAYWFFLMQCNSEVNYLHTKEVRNKLLLLFYILDNHLRLQTEHLNFSNQNFSEADFNYVFFAESDFTNSVFKQSDLFKTQFYSVYFKNTSFESGTLTITEFYDCDFLNTSFEKATLDNVEFEDCKFFNTSFKDCQIHEITLKKCKGLRPNYFDGAIFSSNMLIYFINTKIKFNYSRCLLSIGNEPTPITKEIMAEFAQNSKKTKAKLE